jgi:hypothetical protein
MARAFLLALALLGVPGCVTARPHMPGLPDEGPAEILRVPLKWRSVERRAVSLTADLPDVAVYRSALGSSGTFLPLW